MNRANVVNNRRLRVERLRAAREKGRHTTEEWRALVKACGGICVRCKHTGRNVEKDHILPLYRGGSDSIANIQPLCAWCNSGKGPESIDHRPLHVQQALVGI